MRKQIYLLFASLLSFCSTYCQPKPNNIIPPSPTAAGLGRYGDVPVSYYTGKPNINIPLYEVSLDGKKIPISLNYYVSGIKVEEDASWVGLGWNLFAGGVITKSTRGLSDLAANSSNVGYPDVTNMIHADENNNYLPSSNIYDDADYFNTAWLGYQGWDTEPDIFYFNFCGHSGQFVFDKRTNGNDPLKVVLRSQEKMDISVSYSSTKHQWEWLIKTEDGTKYYFSTAEYNYSFSASSISEQSADYQAGLTIGPSDVSSWYLDKIQALNGEEINFTYRSTAGNSNGTKRTLIRSDEQRVPTLIKDYSGSSTGVSSHTYFATQVAYYDVYLDQITFKNGKIQFTTSDRDDIESGDLNSAFGIVKAQKLDNVVISKYVNNSYQTIKSYSLGYSYYTELSNSAIYHSYSNSNPYTTSSNPYLAKRLKLDNVTETDALGAALPPYVFEYKDIYLPAKNSKSRDHWGFFNTASNETVSAEGTGIISTLIPDVVSQAPYFPNYVHFGGANRNTSANNVTIGMLKKITYPTGGETTFDFESNDFNTTETVTNEQVESVLKGGPNTIGYENEISVKQVTFTAGTPVKVVLQYYSEDWECTVCSSSPPEMIVGFVIRSTGSTPSFYKPYLMPLDYSGPNITTYDYIPAGTYEIEAYSSGYYVVQGLLSWEQSSTNQLVNKPGGGIRIKTITHYDKVDASKNQIQNFIYKETVDNVERSSGILMSQPKYSYYAPQVFVKENWPFDDYDYNHTMLIMTSSSNVPLGTSAQGEMVGYTKVSVISNNDGAVGKSEYTFSNSPDPLPQSDFPNMPVQGNLANGFLNLTADFKKNANGSYQKVKEVEKHYDREPDMEKTVKGMKLFGSRTVWNIHAGGDIDLTQRVKFYDYVSDWWHPTGETVRSYDPNDETKYTETSQNYIYDNPDHYQLTRVEEILNNKKHVTQLTYPLDYAAGTGFIDDMKAAYIASTPIEKVVYEEDLDGTNKKILSGEISIYQTGGQGLKTEHWQIETPQSINQLAFKFSNLGLGTLPPSNTNYTFSKDSHYQKKWGAVYNSTGLIRLASILPDNGQPASYLWGYNEQYPVAEVKNARANEVYNNNFEEATDYPSGYVSQSATRAHTGTYSGLITNPASSEVVYHSNTWLQISNTQTKKYRFSGWVYSDGPSVDIFLFMKRPGETGYYSYVSWASTSQTNGWIYIYNEFDVPADITQLNLRLDNNGGGNVWFDDLRISPAVSQMTTYTYTPLIGMTSSIDSKGLTTRYEYDTFQRLVRVRDEKGNIIKEYKYHYQNQ